MSGKVKSRIFFGAFLVLVLFSGQVFSDRCPECVDPQNNTCKPWANGQARFQWASGGKIGSDITLTAGPCGEQGEEGTAYIFSRMDGHPLRCDNNSNTSPCGGNIQNLSTFAIIRVSGNQRAFKHIFPSGLSFRSNYWVLASNPHYAYTSVDMTNCSYQLLVSNPQDMKVTLTASVVQCQPEFDNSKFGINITFWQTRSDNPYSYSMLSRAQGSITVKTNKRTNCDPINFRPDLRDGSAIAWIEEIRHDYDHGQNSPWEILYLAESGQDTCTPNTQGWLGPVASENHILIPRNETFYRVKYPTYKTDMNGTAPYASMEGWSFDSANKRIVLNLGLLGKIYYHCDKQVGNRYLLSSVEHCEVGVQPGSGTNKWKLLYNTGNQLQYIYNGLSVVDPNNPQTGTQYYSFAWDGRNADIEYHSRKTTQGSWGLERHWELGFDDNDRAVKFKANCSGGCGGSGEFEHVEYHSTYEDVIVKRLDASGETILENTVAQLIYGQYEPAYWIWITNNSFEFPDVDMGCQQANDIGWDIAGDPANVLICDANDAPDGNQVLRLTGTVTVQQTTSDVVWKDTKYYFQFAVRSIPGPDPGNVIISLVSTNSTITEPFVEIQYQPNGGQWTYFNEEFDSAAFGVQDDDKFVIRITGSNVDVDDFWLSAVAFVGNLTKPVITQQKVYDTDSQSLITVAQWDYNHTDYTVLERKYVDTSDFMATKYEYQDGSFTGLKKRIDCKSFNDDPDNPAGEIYTTIYDPNDSLRLYTTRHPNGKRSDVRLYNENGLLVESYVVDTVTDANTLIEKYDYINLGWQENPRWEVKKHVNSRGGITEYNYKRFGTEYSTPDLLLEWQKQPETAAGRQEIRYDYDGAQRVIKESRKDTEGNWVRTWYDYDPNTGYLNWVVADWGGVHAKTWYMRNNFGQVTRQFNPDNVMTGKSYGLGGELVSEFVISASCDPNDPDSQLVLISQTRYEYNIEGQLEKVRRAKHTGEFTYDAPDEWIVAKYQYDPQGRKTKVIEDYDEFGLRFNLTTTYEYDLQGRLTKTTYPTGKWVCIERDGRGLVTREITGHGQTDVYETVYDYDANGNLTEQVNPDGTELLHIYNNFDQLERTYRHSTSGPYTLWLYDDAGAVRLEQVIDPNGIILRDVRREYDVLGNLVIERVVAAPGNPDDAEDFITIFDYDIAGNLRKRIQKGIGSETISTTPEASDAVIEHFYDTLNRRRATKDPEGIYSCFYYSDAGQLQKLVDPNIPDPNQIFTTTNFYDGAGRLEKVVNPQGHYTINTYNSLNQIIRQVVWDCSLTPDDQIDDVPVRQIRYEYDNLGNVKKRVVMKDPGSTGGIDPAVDMVVDSILDASTGLLDETRTYYGSNATAAVTSYKYDGIGRNWRTIDPEGNETRTYYHPANGFQVVKQERIERDPADSNNDYTITVFFDYDDLGNLFRRTLDEDADGIKDATDPSTYFHYDALDRLVRKTGPDLVQTYHEYDAFGNIKLTVEDYNPSSQNALNKSTEYVYDRMNRQSHVIAYDPNDTTPLVDSQVTSYEYNKRGQVEKIIYPDESFVRYFYNNQRRIDREVRRDGTSIYYWYDYVGNVIIESDDEYLEFGSPSFITEYEYNAAGDLVGTYKEEDGLPVALSIFHFNGLGLADSESTALYGLDAKTTTYTYDGSGNALTRTHNGQTITYSHHGLGRIKSIDRGDDRIANYHYSGSSTKVVEYPEADTQWEGYYDGLGRIERCRSIGPDAETLLDLIYTYDENSNRDSVKYNHLPVPVWDIYTYDNLQRLIQADYGSPAGLARLEDFTEDILFASRVASRWVSSDDPFIELAQLQVRDLRKQQRQVQKALIDTGLDRLVKEHTGGEMPLLALVDFGGEEEKDQSTYEMLRNDSGEMIGIIITDSMGRITIFTLYPAVGGTLVVTIGYDITGAVSSKVFSSYDQEGSLVEQVDMLAMEASIKASSLDASRSTSLSRESLDGGGMMMMSLPSGPQAATEQFAYDHLGNRYQVLTKDGLVQTFAHNLNNQYTHINDYLFFTRDYYPEHDANGNLKKDHFDNEYSYDYRNRLKDIAGIAQYGYDALGRRISKHHESSNLTTYFYYDLFGRVIAEYEKPDSGTEKLARTFVYGNGIDEVLAMFLPEKSFNPDDVLELAAFCETWLADSYDANFNALYDYDSNGFVDFNDFAVLADAGWSLPTTKETRFYYLRDALGSVIGIVGGRLQRESDREFYLYDVYGTVHGSSACGNPYFFTGRRLDTESGLYYYRFRTYDPKTGRFLQTDPMGYVDSMNLYEYVMSNPTNWVDPWGLSITSGVRLAFTVDRAIQETKHNMVLPMSHDSVLIVQKDYEWCVEEALYRILNGYEYGGMLHLPDTRSYEYALTNTLSSLEWKKEYWVREYARRQLHADYPPGLPFTSLLRGTMGLLMSELNTPYDTDIAMKDLGWGVFELLAYASVGCARGPSKAFNYCDDLIRDVSLVRGVPANAGVLGRGSTINPAKGRFAASNLREQLAIRQAMSNPAAGRQLRTIQMTDSRWPASEGWVKMQQMIKPGGSPINVHYVYNTKTGLIDDLKIVIEALK